MMTLPFNSAETELENLAQQTTEKYQMMKQGEEIVVGFSGGADSVALLHLLYSWKGLIPLHITAVHLNHLLRGKESQADEAFAKSFCEERGINFLSRSVDVRKTAENEKLSIEEAARHARYDFFTEITKGTGKIATAHTLSDSLETMIFNLTRGTGPKGLKGIPPVRGQIIRPLIQVTRQQVEDYCSYYDLAYVIDSSNHETIYHRNKIRMQVLPILREINPNIEKAAGRLSLLLEEDELFLTQKAKEYEKELVSEAGYNRQRFLKLPVAISSRILGSLLEEKGLERSYNRLALLGSAIKQGKNVQLSDQHFLLVSQNFFLIDTLDLDNLQEEEISLSRLLEGKTFLLISGKQLEIKEMECKETENNCIIDKRRLNSYADYDKMGRSITIRHRMGGDLFSPQRRGVTKSLKKLFNEEKIPIWQRSKLTLLETKDHILWLEEFGVDQAFAVTPETKRIVEFRLL